MTTGRVVPHTRDCNSHWDGECSCAPKTREDLQMQIDWLRACAKHWETQATERGSQWAEAEREREEAQAELLAVVGDLETLRQERDETEAEVAQFIIARREDMEVMNKLLQERDEAVAHRDDYETMVAEAQIERRKLIEQLNEARDVAREAVLRGATCVPPDMWCLEMHEKIAWIKREGQDD